jgi:hypothetical protein
MIRLLILANSSERLQDSSMYYVQILTVWKYVVCLSHMTPFVSVGIQFLRLEMAIVLG